MNLEPIAALDLAAHSTQLLNAAALAAPPAPPANADATAFSGLLEQIEGLNARLQASDAALQSVALGNGAELHRVLMDLESTRLSFDLMLQVRNKALDAYQELMRLQV
jgi:flagellar hook-basal body complex protein FliE